MILGRAMVPEEACPWRLGEFAIFAISGRMRQDVTKNVSCVGWARQCPPITVKFGQRRPTPSDAQQKTTVGFPRVVLVDGAHSHKSAWAPKTGAHPTELPCQSHRSESTLRVTRGCCPLLYPVGQGLPLIYAYLALLVP